MFLLSINLLALLEKHDFKPVSACIFFGLFFIILNVIRHVHFHYVHMNSMHPFPSMILKMGTAQFLFSKTEQCLIHSK